MYILKEDSDIKINQTIASEVIGLSQPTLSNILNRKVACRKVVAFCIAKYIDDNANIEDYFELVKRGE
jgi:plasmid maintenance system antidote protein VapI